ncbi:MAG TPA: hypothetical protein VEI06_10200 [Gemmatimonadaceae bacterium]|nr:hypothetical protein [Gemmatimonadaceae bacterium]
MSLRILFAGAAVVLAAGAASPARAQALPNVMAPKAAAQRAAAATNAHIAAEQADQGAQPAAPPAGGSSSAAPASAAASVRQQASSGTTDTHANPPAKGTAPAKGAAPGKDAKTGKAATAPATPPAPAAGPGQSSVTERSGKSEISLMREAFTYQPEGRRDPFLSLMRTGDLRPMVSDLKLVTIVYDPTGRSVAILRDITTKEQYRVKVGQTLGRMRVAQIQPKAVTFTVEEIGTVVQEVLAMTDTTRARSQ